MRAHKQQPEEQRIVEKVANQRGLQAEVTPPFDLRFDPAGMSLPMELRRAAFNLRPDQPYTPLPVLTGDAAYVAGLHEIVPSRSQPLEDVRERVVQDFRRAEALRLARQAGEELQQEIAHALAEGKSYAAVREEKELAPVSLSFSMNTQELPELEGRQVTVGALQNAAANLEPGQISNVVPTRDGGFVLVLHGYFEVDEERMKEEFPDFLAGVRNDRQNAAFFQWIQEQRQHIRIPQPAQPEEEAFAR
jgi:hypothetical protein